MITVTSERLRKTGEIDEKRYAAFVAKNTKQNMRARDKANAKGLRDSGWYGLTDEECRKSAEEYCSIYRGQFAIFAPLKDGER